MNNKYIKEILLGAIVVLLVIIAVEGYAVVKSIDNTVYVKVDDTYPINVKVVQDN